MQWLAVAMGGALGALGRYGLLLLLPYRNSEFPWPIFMANCLGSICIGLCYVLIIENGLLPEHWRSFISIGILGALTTYSTFALDTVLLWHQGEALLSVVYVLSSVVACIFCAAGSILLAQKLF